MLGEKYFHLLHNLLWRLVREEVAITHKQGATK